MNALVTIRDGAVRATSQDVAGAFEKAHKDVLRAIDNMIVLVPEISRRNFAPRDFMSRGRSYRAFDMDRDGFALLAMGFTGAKALEWKLKFLDAFNRMQETLRSSLSASDDDEPMAFPMPDSLHDLEVQKWAMQMVKVARDLGGRRAGRRMWALKGFPAVFDEEASGLSLLVHEVEQPMAEWMRACCDQVAGHREEAGALFASYATWCGRENRPIGTATLFGRYLTASGVLAIKNSEGRRSRVGLRLTC